MASKSNNRQATADELEGLAWWNRLLEGERSFWLLRSGKGSAGAPADAWKAFKAAGRDMSLSWRVDGLIGCPWSPALSALASKALSQGLHS
jgi:hypothetical protein